MRRLPYGLQTFGRESYYAALQAILEWLSVDSHLDLRLDRDVCPLVIITAKKDSGFLQRAKHLTDSDPLLNRIIIAQLESDHPIAEPDDNCNERYHRRYDGMELHIVEEDYRAVLEKFIQIAEDLFNRKIKVV